MKKKIMLIIFTVFSLIMCINTVYADETYNNYDVTSSTVSCGPIDKIPSILPKTVSVIYTIILIAVPVILVILGMIDMLKAITASKEDELNKAKNMFVKRLISALLIFFVLAVVKLVIAPFADDSDGIFNCVECFISNDCNTIKNNGYDIVAK